MKRMRPVLIDCDPGHDDALALLLAAASPRLQLVGITTVAGNQTLEKTTANAQKIVELIGLEVPVVPGAHAPLVAPLVTAPHIHGESGLDGPELPPPRRPPDPRHAVEFILESLEQFPGLTIVALGPLTNLALALKRDRRAFEALDQLIFMGGSTERGNITPAAEFNIYVDPEAAHIVVHSGLKVSMVGLNLTHQVRVSREMLKRIEALGTPVARVAAELLNFYGGTYRKEGFQEPPLHDPCAVALAIQPELFELAPAHVEIELKGAFTRGATICDFRGEPKNLHVALDIAADRFWDLFLQALAHYR
jgi:purine nucleosidase